MSNMTQDNKVTCPLCGKCVKISKTGKVSRHKSAYDYSGGSYYAGCSFSGNTLDTPLETLRSFVEAEVNGESVSKRELEVLDAALPVVETPVETPVVETPVETPVVETPVETPVVETPVETPVVETEEARCYHVTRCKFDPRGNPSAWVTDSSYSTLNEARARCAELVAELGGAVDPSSLSAHSCETVGDVGIQLVYDTLPARDNTKTYVGAHSGAYLYETTQEEEARVIRVTPPQVDALRALGYEVRSCKLRYSPSQAEEILDSLYAERKLYTGAQRRVYTSIIDKVSQETKQAPSAALLPGDLRIEYRSFRAQRQILELIDAAERAGIVSRGSASTLRASVTPCINIVIR